MPGECDKPTPELERSAPQETTPGNPAAAILDPLTTEETQVETHLEKALKRIALRKRQDEGLLKKRAEERRSNRLRVKALTFTKVVTVLAYSPLPSPETPELAVSPGSYPTPEVVSRLGQGTTRMYYKTGNEEGNNMLHEELGHGMSLLHLAGQKFVFEQESIPEEPPVPKPAPNPTPQKVARLGQGITRMHYKPDTEDGNSILAEEMDRGMTLVQQAQQRFAPVAPTATETEESTSVVAEQVIPEEAPSSVTGQKAPEETGTETPAPEIPSHVEQQTGEQVEAPQTPLDSQVAEAGTTESADPKLHNDDENSDDGEQDEESKLTTASDVFAPIWERSFAVDSSVDSPLDEEHDKASKLTTSSDVFAPIWERSFAVDSSVDSPLDKEHDKASKLMTPSDVFAPIWRRGFAIDPSIGSPPDGSPPGTPPLAPKAVRFSDTATIAVFNTAAVPSEIGNPVTSRTKTFASEYASDGNGLNEMEGVEAAPESSVHYVPQVTMTPETSSMMQGQPMQQSVPMQPSSFPQSSAFEQPSVFEQPSMSMQSDIQMGGGMCFESGPTQSMYTLPYMQNGSQTESVQSRMMHDTSQGNPAQTSTRYFPPDHAPDATPEEIMYGSFTNYNSMPHQQPAVEQPQATSAFHQSSFTMHAPEPMKSEEEVQAPVERVTDKATDEVEQKATTSVKELDDDGFIEDREAARQRIKEMIGEDNFAVLNEELYPDSDKVFTSFSLAMIADLGQNMSICDVADTLRDLLRVSEQADDKDGETLYSEEEEEADEEVVRSDMPFAMGSAAVHAASQQPQTTGTAFAPTAPPATGIGESTVPGSVGHPTVADCDANVDQNLEIQDVPIPEAPATVLPNEVAGVVSIGEETPHGPPCSHTDAAETLLNLAKGSSAPQPGHDHMVNALNSSSQNPQVQNPGTSAICATEPASKKPRLMLSPEPVRPGSGPLNPALTLFARREGCPVSKPPAWLRSTPLPGAASQQESTSKGAGNSTREHIQNDGTFEYNLPWNPEGPKGLKRQHHDPDGSLARPEAQPRLKFPRRKLEPQSIIGCNDDQLEDDLNAFLDEMEQEDGEMETDPELPAGMAPHPPGLFTEAFNEDSDGRDALDELESMFRGMAVSDGEDMETDPSVGTEPVTNPFTLNRQLRERIEAESGTQYDPSERHIVDGRRIVIRETGDGDEVPQFAAMPPEVLAYQNNAGQKSVKADGGSIPHWMPMPSIAQTNPLGAPTEIPPRKATPIFTADVSTVSVATTGFTFGADLQLNQVPSLSFPGTAPAVGSIPTSFNPGKANFGAGLNAPTLAFPAPEAQPISGSLNAVAGTMAAERSKSPDSLFSDDDPLLDWNDLYSPTPSETEPQTKKPAHEPDIVVQDPSTTYYDSDDDSLEARLHRRASAVAHFAPQPTAEDIAKDLREAQDLIRSVEATGEFTSVTERDGVRPLESYTRMTSIPESPKMAVEAVMSGRKVAQPKPRKT